mmetsp:Transcript_94110/g.304056  ORF Transcript_94110/g.304056 Transcript_94110/m.304056 type:complete len:244 (+) Transcript_94110:504-1235(+)
MLSEFRWSRMLTMLRAFWERLACAACCTITGAVRRPLLLRSTSSLPIRSFRCATAAASPPSTFISGISGMMLAAIAALVRCWTSTTQDTWPPRPPPVTLLLSATTEWPRGLSCRSWSICLCVCGLSGKSCRFCVRQGTGSVLSSFSLRFTLLSSLVKSVFLPRDRAKVSLLAMAGGAGFAFSPLARSQLSELSVMRPLCCRSRRGENLDDCMVLSTPWPLLPVLSGSRLPRGDEYAIQSSLTL